MFCPCLENLTELLFIYLINFTGLDLPSLLPGLYLYQALQGLVNFVGTEIHMTERSAILMELAGPWGGQTAVKYRAS